MQLIYEFTMSDLNISQTSQQSSDLNTSIQLTVDICKAACNMIDLSIYQQDYQMIWMQFEFCRWSFYVCDIRVIAEQTP